MRPLLLAVLLVAPIADAAQSFPNGKNVPERFAVTTALTELTLPGGTDYLRVEAVDVDAYLVYGSDCTDAGSLPTDYETVSSGSVEYRALTVALAFCVAGSGSGTVVVTPSDQGK